LASLGRTARFYRRNRKSYKKKLKKDKEINARPEQIKKRAELKRIRRKAKKNGNDLTGKDYDHKTKRFIPLKKNRGAAEASRVKGSKRGNA
jgi:hypothetical protein